MELSLTNVKNIKVKDVFYKKEKKDECEDFWVKDIIIKDIDKNNILIIKCYSDNKIKITKEK